MKIIVVIHIRYRRNDGTTFNRWYSPKVENVVKSQQPSFILTKFSMIAKDKLKDYILSVIEKMPKNLSEQRSYVVLQLYRYKMINSDEALKLIYGSQN